MAIEAAGIEYDGLLRIIVYLNVSLPKVPMTKCRLDAPAVGLQRSQQPRNDLINKFFGYNI